MILFAFGPDAGCSDRLVFDSDDIGMAADGAILDILLMATCGWIEWDHDLFAAGIAQVAGLIRGMLRIGDDFLPTQLGVAIQQEFACPPHRSEGGFVSQAVVDSNFNQPIFGCVASEQQLFGVFEGNDLIES